LFDRLQRNFDHWALAPAPQSDPERAIEDRECWASVHRAIDRLPRAQRVVVVLHYLEGLSTREIAEVMDIAEGTVKSRLHYARLKLKKSLQDEGIRSVAEVVYDFSRPRVPHTH
ncbi:MAG: RNA polymerase sigma factor, partial [Anaerolineae bacterium]|nr:RNA polymerase sigma factor [Anaerolineae bacterium]